MSGHTPGPWRVVPPPVADNGNPWRVAGGDHTIAIVPNWPREADARLIAGAPPMAYALQIAELHLSISDRSCADGGSCGECLGCSARMAMETVRAAMAEAGVSSL